MCNETSIINKLQAVVSFNKAKLDIERPFIGFPYGPALLIKSLINLADPTTGIVYDVSYHELAKLLEINSAPGRKESGTPSKQTIRNYIKSIEKECGEYFKVVSEGQSLKFLFPELPKIFSKIFENTEVNILSNSVKTLENIDENRFFDEELNTELNIEVNTSNPSVKKLFININNNTNNNNLGQTIGDKNLKQPISPNFYPSLKTIARAIASGYSFATDANIIQEFIDKNTAWGSTFADFNPIYLSFLAKHAELKQQESVTLNTQTRSKDNERASPKVNSYDAALEEVRRNNQSACKPSTDELFPTSKVIVTELEHASRFVALGGINQDLRPFVSY
ncbi:hypothetical protein [Legionella taurinensis]|uniref:hypothetical protein n=1 Tax=Legionella taurinensis TaxID=70611 RepID=UPI00299D76C7|nr:hypothetical protein [Legionella taurinensis]MDX1838096.1 hypothetical protein [Legionella taurinensis]